MLSSKPGHKLTLEHLLSGHGLAGTHAYRDSVVTSSYRRLKEAVQLDPSNQRALDNLNRVRELAHAFGILLP